MKQTFKFLTLSTVFNDCRDTVGRLSTLFLLLALSFGFTQQAWARRIFLDENGQWDKDGAIFKVNTWNGWDATDISMTKLSGTVWYADINDAAKDFNFRRMSSDGKTQWGYVNLTVSGMGSNNLYKLTSYDGGSWSKMIPIFGGTFYFDDSKTKWGDATLLIGKDGYTNQYGTTLIPNTQIRYSDRSAWGGATFIAFMKCSGWSGTNWDYNNVKNCLEGYTGAYTSDYTFNVNSLNLFTCEGTGKTLNVTYQSSYEDLNKTQSVEIWVSTDGGSTYSQKTTSLSTYGGVKATYYYMSGAHETTQNSNKDIVTYSQDAVITSTMSLNATAATGYTLKGYSTSSSSTPTTTDTSKPYTYTISGETTTRVYFALQSHNITYAENSNIASYSAQPTTGYYNNTITVTATATNNHVITGASTNVQGVNPTFTSGQNEQTATITFTMPASDIQLTWTTALGKVNLNFGDDGNGTLVAKIGEDTQTTGSQINGGSVVNFTATPNIGYEVEGWYSDSEFNTKIDDSKATTRQVTANADVNVYVKFKETDYNITLFKGTGISAIQVAGVTSSSVTAHVDTKTGTISAEMLTGYQWSTWTVTSGSITSESDWTTNGVQINATSSGTLTATATEIPYTVGVQSANTNMGTVNTSSVTAYVKTASTQITATPKTGYYFTGWTKEGNITITNASSATTTINATGIGTVTANFAERWVLRGSKKNSAEKGGMPADDAHGLMTTIDAQGVASIDVTLEPNIDYQFKIYDNQSKQERGQANSATIKTSDNWKLDGSNYVYLATVGYGTYTIKVKESSDRAYPEVSYTAPSSHKITMDTKTDKGDGGTLTAKTTENATDFVVSDGKYVRSGGEVVFTATPETGYSFAGFYSDAACTNQITTGVTNNTYTTTIIAPTSVYAKFTENMTKVIINWDGYGKVQVKNGDNWVDATKGVTFVQAGVYTHPDVKAVLDDGKSGSHYFAKWTWNANADFEAENWDEDHSETKVIGKGAGLKEGQVLTANFLELDKIYFNNGVEGVYHWPTGNSIHVFFDVKWDSNKGVYPAGCKHYAMTQIGTTNIWWTYIPRLVYKGIWHTLAFADADMSMNDYFHGNHAAYRFDFDSYYNMYVPEEDGENKNTTAYYSEGYWMRYEGYQSGNETGYELHKKSDGSLVGKFIATSPNEGRVDCRLDQTGDAIGFYVSTTQGNVGFGSAEKFTSASASHELSHYRADFKFDVKVDAEGDYSFTLKFGEGKKMILEVGFPVGVGDYRVVTGTTNRISDVVKSGKSNATLSLYYNGSEDLKLQKCTSIPNGVPVWNSGTSIAHTAFNKGQGVYQFDITIVNDNGTASNVGLYTGNYYIKTDGVKGGWGNYKENIMEENSSTFSKEDASTYDRYYCQWISNEGKKYNVKCVIANDYCNALSDTLREDNYTEMSGTEPLLPQPANVRFSYNTFTNTLSRAYISGSTDDASKFLVLMNTNNKMYDKTGTNQIHEQKFDDNNNWVYQADIQAQPGCEVKLTAQYDNKIQYFIGSGTTGKTIITGSSTNKYTMRVVYDFKTNLLIAGWVPDGKEITDTIKLGGDMLISRTHQDSAQQIIFGTTGSIEDIHHIYGVLSIKKDTMLGTSTSPKYKKPATNADYERTMYWVSFPFKVKISEIFGVDGYGTKWIMQKYRGDLRAQKGWFKQDTPTFWEYMDVTDSLNAYEGYLFIIDASYFNTEDADVWKNSATEANFYFPSASGNIGIINKSEYTQKVPAHACGIDREFEVDGVGTVNHKNTDSYWNVIGVPAFQNKSLVLGTETTTEMKAIYEWNSLYNTYTPKALADEFRFQTMHAYMVQFGGDITWSDVSVVNNPTTAPYRYADTKNYFIKLFFGNTEAEDHAYINLADEASTDFVLNEDMMKLDNAGYPNIYSFAGNYNVAYNETKMTNQSVTIGVSAPKDGSYTFSMPKDFSGSAILVDLEEGIYTDLNVSNYSVDLNKGTYNNRFQLMLEVEAKIPTNIQNTNGGLWSEDGKTQKLLINDQIYLINGGRVYNATGTMVR